MQWHVFHCYILSSISGSFEFLYILQPYDFVDTPYGPGYMFTEMYPRIS